MHSPLAKRVPGVRDPKKGGVQRKAWGLLYHTTGRGLTDQAKREKRTPLDVAIETYIASQNGSNGYLWGGPNYVMDHDGSVYLMAPEEILTNHAGPGKTNTRAKYMDGSWIKLAHPAAVAAWFSQWGPRYKHPYELFPSKSPNVDYIGIEMIPCGSGFGEPMRPGLLFTKAQHDVAVDLAQEVGDRYGWPKGWYRTPRLVGHEDVDILNRMDKLGGWDPGFLRAKPFFDFDYIRGNIT